MARPGTSGPFTAPVPAAGPLDLDDAEAYARHRDHGVAQCANGDRLVLLLAAELRAARAVVAGARFVGREDLDETDVAERLADQLDAYDRVTRQRRAAGE